MYTAQSPREAVSSIRTSCFRPHTNTPKRARPWQKNAQEGDTPLCPGQAHCVLKNSERMNRLDQFEGKISQHRLYQTPDSIISREGHPGADANEAGHAAPVCRS